MRVSSLRRARASKALLGVASYACEISRASLLKLSVHPPW